MKKNIRLLGKAKTALAIKKLYPQALMFDESNINEYDKKSNILTVVSPGIPPFSELVKNTKNIISDYDLFLTNDNMSINNSIYSIWISGTNGKTTTSQMCEYILKDKNFIACGNIGLPLAQAIENYKKLIIESSSYTLHYTSYAKPNIYVLLPISPDHLSWHGSFKDYENSKLKPLFSMNKDDTAIIPSIYKHIKSDAKIIYYDSSNDLANKLNINLNKIKFKEPFLFDALLALSVEKILFDDLSYEKINTFKKDVHKMEEFALKDSVLYVDDSKATNIDATIQALKTYKNNFIHIILGGDDKGVELNLLFEELINHNIIIYGIGSNTKKIYDLSKQNNIKCFDCYNLINATNKIKEKLIKKNNTIVLLSPAASSYDQFDSYKQRGEIFKNNIL